MQPLFFHQASVVQMHNYLTKKTLFLAKRPLALCSQPPAKTEARGAENGQCCHLCHLRGGSALCDITMGLFPENRKTTENRMFEASKQQNQQMDFSSQSLRFLLDNTAE